MSVLSEKICHVADVTIALDPGNRESHSSIKETCKNPHQSSHVLGLKWNQVKEMLVVS